MKRRTFIRNGGLASIGLATGLHATSLYAPKKTSFTILHTNDVHSRIEPFAQDGSKYAGLGGAAKRAELIKLIRSEQENVLLLDAGDIFQGTPYFNYFGGEIEFKLMDEMQYDAATIGNHDFDGGIDGLHKQAVKSKFSLINCNYDFSDTVMHDQVKPYQVFQKGGVKVGVLGVGIELEGLVPQTLFKNTIYQDPVKAANQTAQMLKKELGCQYVICLSHLGYKYKGDKVSDHVLASESVDIDLILGGHTHTFLDKPTTLSNQLGKQVLVNQAGWAGIVLGQMEIEFEKKFKNKCVSCKPNVIS
jgi:5'-nucleotidase